MKPQYGLSLVSVMIGLLLAAITLMAMLALFGNTVKQGYSESGTVRRSSRDSLPRLRQRSENAPA